MKEKLEGVRVGNTAVGDVVPLGANANCTVRSAVGRISKLTDTALSDALFLNIAVVASESVTARQQPVVTEVENLELAANERTLLPVADTEVQYTLYVALGINPVMRTVVGLYTTEPPKPCPTISSGELKGNAADVR
ncbi:hypothetical protein EON64_00130 [archaeon]|nr:MAG: hypothetical protein EON64_00130 [archaeon]